MIDDEKKERERGTEERETGWTRRKKRAERRDQRDQGESQEIAGEEQIESPERPERRESGERRRKRRETETSSPKSCKGAKRTTERAQLNKYKHSRTKSGIRMAQAVRSVWCCGLAKLNEPHPMHYGQTDPGLKNGRPVSASNEYEAHTAPAKKGERRGAKLPGIQNGGAENRG